MRQKKIKKQNYNKMYFNVLKKRSKNYVHFFASIRHLRIRWENKRIEVNNQTLGVGYQKCFFQMFYVDTLRRLLDF
jgi:hypothetical protein